MLVLRHFKSHLKTIVETDASDYAVAGVLLQIHPEKNLEVKHPIAFDSCKMLAAKLNYPIHDKELLAIIFCFQKWQAYLLSCSDTVTVITDHLALRYFMSTKVLT